VQEYLAGGEIAKAMQNAHALAARHPTDPRAWRLMSSVHSNAGRLQEALECSQRALSLARNDPHSLLLYAQSLVANGRRREALEIAERLSSSPLDRADWLDALGTLFTYCEDPARALPHFERAAALAPRSTAYLYNLATAQRMTGELAAAENSLDAVIMTAPSDAEAVYTRADLRTQTPDRNHVDQMLRMLEAGVARPRDEILLCFALAKELEDVSRYEESFAYLKRGCELQRRLITYDVSDDVATIDRIIQLHDRVAVERGVGLDTPEHECIFVLGLPRSGTTLVERILAGHSALKAAGELQTFPAETIKAVQRHVGRAVGKFEFAESALHIDPRALGQAYFDGVYPQAPYSPRLIDKQPLNYLYLGLIRRALPRARIVALLRDPMDSCYAMYKTLFSGAYPFSYDLSDLGHYYVAWHRLMRHWQSVLGESLLIVQYENLVANHEMVSRRIVEHCGLMWEDACLAFDQQRSAVTTASAVQVRRSIYSTSVGKWCNYERQLAPLSELLRQQKPLCGWDLATTSAAEST